ncbi:MAG: hypothetical protein J7L90_01605 [Dehalococcoidia bacterium]|nr:hypothetical protein [Dehalococcoidia bacterium]
MLKVLVIVLATIVVLVLIAAAVGYHFITQPSDIAQEVSLVTVSDEAVRSLDDKVNEFAERMAEAPDGERMALVLTDDEITSKLVEELSSADVELPLDMENPLISFVDDKIFASAEVEISGFRTTLGIEARVEVQGDKLKVVIDEVNLGSLPLPGVVIDKIKENIIPEDELLLDLDDIDIPIDISNVRVEDGQLLLEGIAG